VENWHDNYGDYGRGINSAIGIEADGLRVRHMGDYGQKQLTDEQIERFGRVDILLIPWGDWTPALLHQLKPKVVFPMHHAKVDDFMRSLKGFSEIDSSEVEFNASSLPSEMKCLMLKQSRE
jgi:L-ascorbate metabolism protein UlaG (beta-lactamase superfamily)